MIAKDRPDVNPSGPLGNERAASFPVPGLPLRTLAFGSWGQVRDRGFVGMP